MIGLLFGLNNTLLYRTIISDVNGAGSTNVTAVAFFFNLAFLLQAVTVQMAAGKSRVTSSFLSSIFTRSHSDNY